VKMGIPFWAFANVVRTFGANTLFNILSPRTNARPSLRQGSQAVNDGQRKKSKKREKRNVLKRRGRRFYGGRERGVSNNLLFPLVRFVGLWRRRNRLRVMFVGWLFMQDAMVLRGRIEREIGLVTFASMINNLLCPLYTPPTLCSEAFVDGRNTIAFYVRQGNLQNPTATVTFPHMAP
jgi:hypothetical protein